MEDFILDPNLVLYLPLYRLDGTVFMSQDHYGHLCTVSGATWGIQGRTLDGVTNDLSIPDAVSLDMSNTLTIMIWLKRTTAGARHGLINKWTAGGGRSWELEHEAGNTYYWSVSADVAAAGFRSLRSSAYADTISFHCMAVTANASGDSYLMYRDGVSIATTLGGAAIASIYDSSAAISIGEYVGANNFAGIVGEVSIYNRVLTPQEIQDKYLETNWRYS